MTSKEEADQLAMDLFDLTREQLDNFTELEMWHKLGLTALTEDDLKMANAIAGVI